MKFLLDEDSNAKICSRLRSAGHRAEIAQRAGYSHTRDEYVAEFADEIGAVFLSHDVVFHRDRQRTVISGHHVLLIGGKRSSPTWVMEHLHALIAKIEGCGHGFYTLEEDGTVSFVRGRAR